MGGATVSFWEQNGYHSSRNGVLFNVNACGTHSYDWHIKFGTIVLIVLAVSVIVLRTTNVIERIEMLYHNIWFIPKLKHLDMRNRVELQ
jgi:hypothetical protein